MRIFDDATAAHRRPSPRPSRVQGPTPPCHALRLLFTAGMCMERLNWWAMGPFPSYATRSKADVSNPILAKLLKPCLLLPACALFPSLRISHSDLTSNLIASLAFESFVER